MAKVTILIGMPGSGKSTFLGECKKEQNGISIFDDYHAYSDTPDFKDGLFYNKLRMDLQNNKNCFIADVAYCDQSRLKEAKEAIENIAADLNIQIDIKCLYFENNAGACNNNVEKRNRKQLEEIKKRSETYLIPDGATVLSVFSEER